MVGLLPSAEEAARILDSGDWNITGPNSKGFLAPGWGAGSVREPPELSL